MREPLRRRLYHQLDPRGWTGAGLSPLNRALMILIVVAVGLAIIETEPQIYHRNKRLFLATNIVFACIFLLEYLARFWVAAERPEPGSDWDRRRLFLASPWSWIDLAIVLATFAPVLGGNALIFRLLRIVRILALTQIGRFAVAMQHLRTALWSRRFELGLTLGLALFLLVIGATLLYWVEGHVQPEKFGSIPRALWWSVVTLTTIGYGDVTPVTPLGKVFAGFVAFAGIGLVAMPTGILAAAFSDAMQEHYRHEREDCEAVDGLGE